MLEAAVLRSESNGPNQMLFFSSAETEIGVRIGWRKNLVV